MTEKEWHDGYPEKRGLYHCLVDNKPMVLTHHRCDLNGRHWWTTTDGFDVVGCEIKWGEKFLPVV